MNQKIDFDSRLTANTFIDSMIRVGLIGVIVVLCYQVFSPFMMIILWALILTIVMYPLHQRLANKRFKGKQGLTSTIMVSVIVIVIGIPLVLLADSAASHIAQLQVVLEDDFKIEPPAASVADWPLIGDRAFTAWTQASENLPKFVQDHAAQLEQLWNEVVDFGANVIGAILLILAAVIISGIMMAYGKTGGPTLRNILIRFSGQSKGAHLYDLSGGVVRSVATGVLGVAFFQALLFGISFMIAGVPGAGVLAVIVMFIGIIQIPAAIVALPTIFWVWVYGDATTGMNVFYTILFIVSGTSDNVLKPLLLGRGVDSPMPVILIGALGGMFTGGFIGMFLGAILLAIGYHIFMDWVKGDLEKASTDETAEVT